MFKYFNKGISTPIAIGIILVLAVLVGGFTLWQFLEMDDEIDEEGLGGEEIESYLKLLSPNGGEEFLIGDTTDITWEFSGIDKIDIGYRREGSGAEINGWIGRNVSTSQGSYSWTITEGVFPGPEYKQGSFEIIIQETLFQLGKSKSDKSDSHFTIVRKNEITDWKTYRNDEYGFELNYPPNWVPKTPSPDLKFPFDDLVISFETDDTEKLVEEGKITPNYHSNLSIRFWFSILEQPEAKINNIEINTIEEFFEEVPTATKVGETTVDGKEAYQYIQGGHGQAYGILIKKDIQIYSLIFDRTWSKEKLPEVEKKVLSTFRFIE